MFGKCLVNVCMSAIQYDPLVNYFHECYLLVRVVGLCQYCIFPFRSSDHSGFEFDCYEGWPWYEPYCPMVVGKEDNVSMGFPFEIGCPAKEPWEEKSTCFVTEKPKGSNTSQHFKTKKKGYFSIFLRFSRSYK